MWGKFSGGFRAPHWRLLDAPPLDIACLGVLLVAIAVTTYVLLEVGVFVAPAELEHHHISERDELPILGIVGLLVVVRRKSLEVRRSNDGRLEAQRQLGELVFVDSLTGLPNRRNVIGALQESLGSPPWADGVHALLLIDLNGFKQINDLYGHGVGDQVLVIVAQRFLGAVRDDDRVGRLGGDELALLAEHLPSAEGANTLALRVLASLDEPCLAGGIEHRVGAGVGICLYSSAEGGGEEVFRRADVALYRAKAARRSAARFFHEDMDALVRDRDRIERALRGPQRGVKSARSFNHWLSYQLDV